MYRTLTSVTASRVSVKETESRRGLLAILLMIGGVELNPGPSNKMHGCEQCSVYYDTLVRAMMVIEEGLDRQVTEKTHEGVHEMKITNKLLEAEKNLQGHMAAMTELKHRLAACRGAELDDLRVKFVALKVAFFTSMGREIKQLKTLTQLEENVLMARHTKLQEFKTAIADLEAVMRGVNSASK